MKIIYHTLASTLLVIGILIDQGFIKYSFLIISIIMFAYLLYKSVNQRNLEQL
ncbi:hypothetical protein EV200_102370 [Pedobacter psychrotolerans]|uniref:Uncharacterized protein n=1 Tax=Pedobacter psychrotolerans TaxID=1843235 RepID=A0A4R2HID9_9SPHI|nr:hypothetical protein EV200_102370 [Pedobacter psychrotolerans]